MEMKKTGYFRRKRSHPQDFAHVLNQDFSFQKIKYCNVGQPGHQGFDPGSKPIRSGVAEGAVENPIQSQGSTQGDGRRDEKARQRHVYIRAHEIEREGSAYNQHQVNSEGDAGDLEAKAQQEEPGDQYGELRDADNGDLLRDTDRHQDAGDGDLDRVKHGEYEHQTKGGEHGHPAFAYQQADEVWGDDCQPTCQQKTGADEQGIDLEEGTREVVAVVLQLGVSANGDSVDRVRKDQARVDGKFEGTRIISEQQVAEEEIAPEVIHVFEGGIEQVVDQVAGAKAEEITDDGRIPYQARRPERFIDVKAKDTEKNGEKGGNEEGIDRMEGVSDRDGHDRRGERHAQIDDCQTAVLELDG